MRGLDAAPGEPAEAATICVRDHKIIKSAAKTAPARFVNGVGYCVHMIWSNTLALVLGTEPPVQRLGLHFLLRCRRLGIGRDRQAALRLLCGHVAQLGRREYEQDVGGDGVDVPLRTDRRRMEPAADPVDTRHFLQGRSVGRALARGERLPSYWRR